MDSIQRDDTQASAIELDARSLCPSSSKSTLRVDVSRPLRYENEERSSDAQVGDVDRAAPAASSLSEDILNLSSLAPVDRGFGAWSFLTAATFIDVIVWGFSYSTGVFLEAYLHDARYSSQTGASSLLPLIGPLASGIMYCSGIVIYPVFGRYPQHRRVAIFLGAILCFGSLFAAGFTQNIKLMILLQGVLYAVGGSILYAPCISYMAEWFVVRRGLANGVIFSGASVGGTVFPFIISQLLQSFSPRKTLLIISISMACIIAPALPFVKGRLPTMHSRVVRPVARSTLAMNRMLWFIIVAMNTVQGFGHFLPSVWLPTFASDLNLSSTQSSAILAILNASTFFGQMSAGMLSDRFSPWPLAISTLILTSLSTFVLWGVLSHSFAGLVVFAITFGILAAGWSSLWAAFVNVIDDPFLATSLFSYLLFSRGVGNILSTPISSALIRSSRLRHAGDVVGGSVHLGYDVGGGKYESMILYAGSCFAGAAVIAMFGWIVDRGRNYRHYQ